MPASGGDERRARRVVALFATLAVKTAREVERVVDCASNMRFSVNPGLVLLVVAVVGCNPYKGNPASVRDPSDVAFDDYGAPTDVSSGHVRRCPSGTNDGDIRLSWGSGAMRIKGVCEGGVMVGTWKGGYANGEDRWKADLIGGKFEGTFKAWYPNGEKLVKLDLTSGVANGSFKAWWENGETREKGEMQNGRRQGCWLSYWQSGKDASKGTYEDGEKVVTWLNWSETGTKQRDKLGGKPTHGECFWML